MKYKSLLVISMALASFSIQSHAAENLCDINLQKIDEVLHTAGQKLGGGVAENLGQMKEQAMQAKNNGDIDKCISLTERALSKADNTSMGGN